MEDGALRRVEVLGARKGGGLHTRARAGPARSGLRARHRPRWCGAARRLGDFVGNVAAAEAHRPTRGVPNGDDEALAKAIAQAAAPRPAAAAAATTTAAAAAAIAGHTKTRRDRRLCADGCGGAQVSGEAVPGCRGESELKLLRDGVGDAALDEELRARRRVARLPRRLVEARGRLVGVDQSLRLGWQRRLGSPIQCGELLRVGFGAFHIVGLGEPRDGLAIRERFLLLHKVQHRASRTAREAVVQSLAVINGHRRVPLHPILVEWTSCEGFAIARRDHRDARILDHLRQSRRLRQHARSKGLVAIAATAWTRCGGREWPARTGASQGRPTRIATRKAHQEA